MKFGDYLKQLRLDRGWTQPEAAAQARIEQSYLSKLEGGKSIPSGDVYDRLAGIYDIAGKDMLDVLFPAELDRLREIDSLREVLLAHSRQRRAAPRRWLIAGLAALAIGGGFLGLSQVQKGRNVQTYTYMSDGVVSADASLDAEPAVRDEQTRFLAQMRGPAFTETSGPETRVWRLVGGGTRWQPARFGWALVPGLASIFAGLGCFFLAWRWR